jgi:hypothetical protein
MLRLWPDCQSAWAEAVLGFQFTTAMLATTSTGPASLYRHARTRADTTRDDADCELDE